MEKHAVKQKRKFCSGLLILIQFFVLPELFAKPLTHSQIKALTVKPDSETFFTAQENGYTLNIPGIEPSKVQTDLPQLPAGIQLLSSKKEEYLAEDGGRGTEVHLWFSFKDSGPVRMPPLIVLIGNRTYYLSFEEVTVYENPALISPVLEVNFLKGINQQKTVDGITRYEVTAGEEIVFELQLKYFVQIVSFNWKLPKNSICQELERYEITRGVPAGSGFSTAALPVVKFSWKPLIEGEYSLPEINLVATAYNGSRKTVHLPPCLINVHPAEKGTQKSTVAVSSESVFSSAFTEKVIKPENNSMLKITIEDCKKLAELRCEERNSLPGKVSKKRAEFEQSLGLSNQSREANVPFVIVLICLSVILLILFIVFIVLGKVRPSLILISFFVISLILGVWGIASLVPCYGIFAGGEISSVPEKVNSSVSKVDGGLRVKISEKAGDYYYIESADINGWVLKELVFEIR